MYSAHTSSQAEDWLSAIALESAHTPKRGGRCTCRFAACQREVRASSAGEFSPSPPPPLPPADWYADPHKVARLRYWDGTQWTEHVAP